MTWGHIHFEPSGLLMWFTLVSVQSGVIVNCPRGEMAPETPLTPRSRLTWPQEAAGSEPVQEAAPEACGSPLRSKG